MFACPVSAQQVANPQQQEQRQRDQREAAQRARERSEPHVRLQTSRNTDYHRLDLPRETPCFKLHAVQLKGRDLAAFSWVSRYLQHYVGRCVGQQGLQQIVHRASDLVLARGYVTTRLLIPQQNLSGGALHLLLIPGRVGRIRFASGSVHADWRSAFPLRPGDLLNLRAIEQGLEQMKRVPSQDVRINIAPGAQPGTSDLVLDVKRTHRMRVGFNYDDSGSEATGKQQGGVQLAVDQPLGMNDLFSMNVGYYVGPNAWRKGTRSNSFRYSVPWGNWTFAFDSSGYGYHQQIEGAQQTFESTGRSRTQSLSATRMVFRNASSRTSLRLSLSSRTAHSSIEGVEIEVQRRHTRAVELAILQRRYLGRAQLDLSLAQRRGVPWFGGQRDASGHASGAPTFHYIINTLDVSLSLPFTWGERPWLWSSTLHAQDTRSRLYAENFITIGGRYTVRGFDGERTLGAERGYFWRNSLTFPLGHSGASLYGGIDLGQVGGPSAPDNGGHTLGGAFIGTRGGKYGFHWDFFAGCALRAPRGFSTRTPAAGMQLIYQY
ncbi:ShlB/FhaC/HecB family hemolysin secretion/activation protein [Oleiagrimonas sp. MCCC 1A03011]|uniref:ShlB/FhaC/HecB family hemolysin secretion/activation protein n=1 Tax=Oleiagrimonas sp. MCCC 1A03011 TaxID=1926883 RepID=UPI00143DC1BB|nr:ShlB/FhaC/HecB family hemolysin secretion/activation protein [Oleiagrimonas sp. MCCC 1A03011]